MPKSPFPANATGLPSSSLPIWKQETALMSRLADAQNHPANINQDIMTFAAMCDTREELEAHVLHAEDRATRYVVPVRRRRKVA